MMHEVALRVVDILREWKGLDSLEERDENGITGIDLAIDFKIGRESAAKYLSEAFSNQWIEVENSLPRNDGQYLVSHPNGVSIATWNSDQPCWDDEYGDDYWRDPIGYVTHWMPLPEPPND